MTEHHSEAWRRYLAGLPSELAALWEDPPADVLPAEGGKAVTVEELLAVLREQTAPVPGFVSSHLGKERYAVGKLAVAWRQCTYGHVGAVLAMFDSGFTTEAHANARAALEHAVILQRLALAADDWWGGLISRRAGKSTSATPGPGVELLG